MKKKKLEKITDEIIDFETIEDMEEEILCEYPKLDREEINMIIINALNQKAIDDKYDYRFDLYDKLHDYDKLLETDDKFNPLEDSLIDLFKIIKRKRLLREELSEQGLNMRKLKKERNEIEKEINSIGREIKDYEERSVIQDRIDDFLESRYEIDTIEADNKKKNKKKKKKKDKK